jgi:hypothetical protein
MGTFVLSIVVEGAAVEEDIVVEWRRVERAKYRDLAWPVAKYLRWATFQ